jgi:diguanylate cyclase (GGDEF)-like protein
VPAMSLSVSVSILSPQPLVLPSAYARRVVGARHFASADELIESASRQPAQLYLVDASMDASMDAPARALQRLAQVVTGQDPPPFVAVFGWTDARPPFSGGAFPFRATSDVPTPEALTQALDAALPHLTLTSRILGLEDEARLLRDQAGERETLAHAGDEKISRLERRVFDFFTLSQVGKALAAIPGLADLSRVFLSMVREVYDSKNCSLLLYDEVRRFFFVQDAIGLDRSRVDAIELSIHEGLFWQVLNAGEPFPIIDSQGNYRFEQLVRKNRLDLLESDLWVPLKVRNALVGILTVGRKQNSSPYHGDERAFLAQLANQATVAFESARLNIQKELATRELRKKMENLSILYSVSKAMNFMNDLKRVLLLILEKAVDAVGAAKASLMLIDEDTGELVVKVVRGVPAEIEHRINSGEMQCSRIKVGEGIAGRVAANKQPILLDDVRTSGEFAEPGRSFVDNILCVPLITSDDCIGVINITNKKNGEKFTSDDVDIMNTLAGQAAVTIYNARLYYLAITDGLTQLHIHRYFQQRLKEEIVRARRFRHPISLIMADVDFFKKFNDTYGHQAGDLVLISVARVIRSAVREVDIAARYGGEEFAVICPETGSDEVAVIAERLRQRVEEVRVPGPGGPLAVTISLGVATFPRDADGQETLIRAADAALYEAKEAGRNRAAVAAPLPPVATGAEIAE